MLASVVLLILSLRGPPLVECGPLSSILFGSDPSQVSLEAALTSLRRGNDNVCVGDTFWRAAVEASNYCLTYPVGHGRPLGEQRPPGAAVPVLYEFPETPEFYYKYVKDRKPLVFKGAQKNSIAFKKWTDAYLKEHYGRMEVIYEPKYENRSDSPKRICLSDFLDIYNNSNVNKYIVSSMPDPMLRDILALPSLYCGSIRRSIQEANLWISSGNTSSLLHYDADNNLNCVLAGTKEWIFIHPKYRPMIPFHIREGEFTVAGADYSLIDSNKINITRFFNVHHIPWQRVTAEAGDCLFLPHGYLHQVRSFDRNVAITFMFLRDFEVPFDDLGCNETDYTKVLPLSDFEFTWTYPGHGPITMGYPNPEEIRYTLMNTFLLATQHKDRELSNELLLTPLTGNAELAEKISKQRKQRIGVSVPFAQTLKIFRVFFGKDRDELGDSVQRMADLMGLRQGDDFFISKIDNLTTAELKKIAFIMEEPHVKEDREMIERDL